MNNPYNQFNIRPRLPVNARLSALQAYYSNSNLNLQSLTLGTVQLRSPTAAYNTQRLCTSLPSNAPVIAVSGNTDFKAVGQVTHSELLGVPSPAFMTNCNSGMTVVPIIQLGAGNQPIRLQQPTNFPGTMGMGVRSGMEANNILPQFVPQNTAAMLRSPVPLVRHVPVVQPSVPHAYNVPTFPGVPIIRSSTAHTLAADVTIPFRPVQWFPGAIHRTGVPQTPYAVEIKPDNDSETPQNHHVPFGSIPVINNTFTVTDGSWNLENANAQSQPSVYMDVAMDDNTPRLHPNRIAADMYWQATKKTVKRKGNQRKNTSGRKVLKLPAIKPCVVSLVRIDSVLAGLKSKRSAEKVCLVDDCKAIESDTDSSPETESVEGLMNLDIPVPVVEAESNCGDESDGIIGNDENAEEDVLDDDGGDCSQSADRIVGNDQDDTPHEDDNRFVNADADRLIGSDEDVGDDDPPHVDDNGSENADRLIGSDEDVEADDQPHNGDNFSTNADDGKETSACYEVTPTDSDALVFDMECDGGKPSETLRVIVPTKRSQTTETRVLPASKYKGVRKILDTPVSNEDADNSARRLLSALLRTKKVKRTKSKTGWSKKKVLPQPKSKPLCRVPPAVISIDADDSDDDDDVIMEFEDPISTSGTRSERTAASACKEKMSAAQNPVESIDIERSENSLLGVPLQSSFFRFEAQSMEVFRLLSMEKGCVPQNVLEQLTDLVASVDATAVDEQSSNGDASSETVSRIPHGGSRKLLFQCLFCPYAELSAKRVMAHVKQQHQMYASFIQCRLLPNRRIPLHIYCRHCNYIAYDSSAMFIHFATYHKVPGILLPQPKDIEQDPDWAPVIDPEANAKEFPFYCCPNCGYVDAEWDRMIHHMLKKHSLESVFLGCVVRLIMFGRASKHLGTFTYQSLARQERCRVTRREIFACVSCRFFSFYPTYAFCHHVVSHSSMEMLYVCAATPSCTKRCSTVEDVISHIQAAHVAMKRLQFQCTATLCDSLTSTQLNITPGELVTADVPVHVGRQSLSASVKTSAAAAIEIDDDDDDISVLSPVQKDEKSNDVKPESNGSDQQIECSGGKDETGELAAESTTAEQNNTELIPNESASTQSDISLGEPVAAGVTVHINRQPLPASVETNLVATIEIDDDDDDGDDVTVLSPINKNDVSTDVEPESDLSDRQSKSSGGRVETGELAAEIPAVERDITKLNPSELASSGQEHLVGEETIQLGREENVEADVAENIAADEVENIESDVVDISDDETSIVPTNVSNELISIDSNDDQASTEPIHEQNMEADVDSRVGDESSKIIDCDSESETSERELDGSESQSVEHPASTCISETSGTELVNADVDSAVTNTDTNQDSAVTSIEATSLADSTAADADSVSPVNVPCSDDVHSLTESVSVPSPPRGRTSPAESVNSAEDQTTTSKGNTSRLTDASTTVADLENLASIAADDEDATEVPKMDDLSAEKGGSGCMVTGAEVTDTSAAGQDMNQLADAAKTVADLEDRTNVAAGSEVHQTDDLSAQEGRRGCTVTEAEITDQQLTDTSAAGQGLFGSDQRKSIEIFNEWLDFDDDTSELPEFPDDQLERSGRDVLGLDEELLLLSEQLTADELQSPDRCSNIKHAPSMNSIFSSEESMNIVGACDPHAVSMDDSLARCLDMSDDTFGSDVTKSEQLHTSEPTAVSEGHDVEKTSVVSYPSCSSEIPSESRDSEGTECIDSANEQRNTDGPVSGNLLRFKSLAGFRFPAPHSFPTKPS